jgi:hypothetical protein
MSLICNEKEREWRHRGHKSKSWPYLLKRLEAGVLAERNHVAHDEVLDLGIVAQHRQRAGYVVGRRPHLDGLHVGHDNGDDAALPKKKEDNNFSWSMWSAHLQALAMHKHLVDILRVHVNVFDLLGHDVLALAQLEDVLLAVDDLEGAVAQPLADVARMVPATRVNRLCRSLLVAEVAGMWWDVG